MSSITGYSSTFYIPHPVSGIIEYTSGKQSTHYAHINDTAGVPLRDVEEDMARIEAISIDKEQEAAIGFGPDGKVPEIPRMDSSPPHHAGSSSHKDGFVVSWVKNRTPAKVGERRS